MRLGGVAGAPESAAIMVHVTMCRCSLHAHHHLLRVPKEYSKIHPKPTKYQIDSNPSGFLLCHPPGAALDTDGHITASGLSHTKRRV